MRGSPRMGGGSLPSATTGRRGCGMRPTADCWPTSKATRVLFGTLPSLSTANASSRPVTTILRVWNAASGQLLATLQGHEDVVRHAAFSADNQHIVTASDDHTARVWDAANGQMVATLR